MVVYAFIYLLFCKEVFKPNLPIYWLGANSRNSVQLLFSVMSLGSLGRSIGMKCLLCVIFVGVDRARDGL